VLPAEFVKMTRPLGVTGTVLIEASPWVEDNQWVLDLARDNPVIVAVIGHLEPGGNEFAAHLERFSANKLFRGLRIGGDALHRGFARPDYMADLGRLAAKGLTLDLLGGASLFADTARLADRYGDLHMILDHLPVVPSGPELHKLGTYPNVYAKVSGILREVDGRVPRDVEFYRASLDELWDVFGPRRLVYGSNWPVSDRVAPYADVLRVVMEYFTARGQEAADQFFWKNAMACYRW
jgi:predicted TIM-barrel fold metal-dependent hydrolase